jgi:hypothetical protein
MQRDRDVNKSGTPPSRFAARSPECRMDGDAAEKWPFDFENKPEKRDATTAPADQFHVRNRNLWTASERRPEQAARALENPITRFVVETPIALPFAL